MEGLKYDQDKPPMALIPYFIVAEIAKVLDHGAKKYYPWNWAKGMNWSRLIGAAERHIGAFKDGEDKDPETGISHLAHAGCCILFLLGYSLKQLGKDDRYKWGEQSKETIPKQLEFQF